MKAGAGTTGLQWRKVDLHVHSPASHDYTGPKITATEFVNAIVAKGVEAIALTDHNSAGWVDDVIAASKGTKLVVFPGAELSVTGGKGGIHIVALFDPSSTAKTVEGMLAKAGIAPEMYGKAEAMSTLGPEAVARVIEECGGLAVLAHADSAKGVMKDMEGMQRNIVMNSTAIAAVELTNIAKSAVYLNGEDPQYKRKLAYYRASDNKNPSKDDGHSVDGVGSRYSWFKVDGLTLDSLKQVFADPDVRIRCDSESSSNPESEYQRIISLEVSQGFLGSSKFEFHRGLNSIIGGKGVGKSLLIEYLRFVLDQPSPTDEIADDMWGKLRDQLGLGGNVTAHVQLEGGQLVRVTRDYTGADNAPVATYVSSGKKVPGDISQLFPLLAYSQTETLLIARDDQAQLSLIDSFLDLAPLEARIEMLEKQLAESDRQLSTAAAAAEAISESDREIATLRERIRALDEAQKSPEFEAVQMLVPKSDAFSALQDAVGELGDVVIGLEESVSQVEIPPIGGELATDQSLKAARALVVSRAKELRAGARKLEQVQRSLVDAVDAQAAIWQKEVALKEAAYKQFVATTGGERPALLARKAQAEAQLKKLVAAAREQRVVADGIEKLRQTRVRLLESLDSELTARFELRSAKYDEISTASGGRITLTIERGGNVGSYCAAVKELKTGSKVHENTINEVCAKVSPRELVALVQSGDAARLQAKAGVSLKAAASLIERLGNLEDQSELLALEHGELLRDRPTIRFRKEDGKYYDLSQLSVGQKCTTLLIVALVDGSRPIVIDQPEDALDITSVYEDVTMQLRRRKASRQFIVTTHNPTVAVAADSDQFHVLSASASQSGVSVVGANDRGPVRSAVIQHLEGGPESLALKNRKYGTRRS